MKTFIKTLLIFLCLVIGAGQSMAVVGVKPVEDSAKEKAELSDELNLNNLDALSVEEFLALTPKQIRKDYGKKLSLKEVIALKVAQKKVKKQLKKGDASGNPKSQLVALLLVIFVGGLGIHRFYLGYTTIGIIQLLTLGGCGIWALIDLIRIVTGDLLPADGSAYDPEL